MTTIWPLLKIALAFIAILTGIRFKLGIGTSILLGSLLLALLFGVQPLEWATIAAIGIYHEKVLLLGGIVLLILYFSDILERSGQGRRMMNHISGLLHWPRPRLVFFPALIGLLPMPGGAIFSAPMLKEIAAPFSISPQRFVQLNYWFRHVWELCWPLYPGIILAAFIADIALFRLLMFTWPSLVLTILLGWLFFLRPGVLPLTDHAPVAEVSEKRSLAPLLRESLPLLIAVFGSLGLEGLIALLSPEIPMEWGFIIALSAAVTCLVLQNRLPGRMLVTVIKSPHALRMLFLVAAIFAFKAVLEQGGIVDALAGSVSTPTALFWISVFLPFIVGMISGLTVAFVGGVLPLIMGLAANLHIEQTTGYVVLVLFSGFIGVLASPLHICLILTCEYFHARLDEVLKSLALPCGIMLLFAVAYARLIMEFW
ncbi:hypothetical protein SAMN05660653_00280 [Desulfonatronum thiosulfatophilum]|uniref:DUF401 family protein n=1 Tax=Desulfonatronum thiosulfatophilum TaxID=617002 RepID=A0A1G6AA81_9BACT|nr:DUF401 family protein [Desulfonatronum thiosulfatophilum]SDB05331.1 hypothetical protein SAMN05660653_00280 [Desulfonatronum thiosulfatophilum]